jgi:hypothetical protein
MSYDEVQDYIDTRWNLFEEKARLSPRGLIIEAHLSIENVNLDEPEMIVDCVRSLL